MEKKKHKTDYFNVDDIHRIREENYKRVKDMSSEEHIKYYNERGEHARLRLEALYKKNRVREERMAALDRLDSLCRKAPMDFDYDEELAEARKSAFGRLCYPRLVRGGAKGTTAVRALVENRQKSAQEAMDML